MNVMLVKDLARSTGCSVVDCNRALKVCGNDAVVAKEFLRLKSQAVVREKRIKGRWVKWSETDYVNEAKRRSR